MLQSFSLKKASDRGVVQLVESRSPKPLVLGSSPSAPAKTPARKCGSFAFDRGRGLEPCFPVGNGFSDGKNEANRLALGIKPRTTLKAVFGRVARNTPPGCLRLAYLAPLPKNPRAIAFGFFILAGRGLELRFPEGNGFSDGKNGANRLALGIKPRTTLKAVFGRVARNTPPGCLVLAYLAPLPKPTSVCFRAILFRRPASGRRNLHFGLVFFRYL